MMRTVSRVKEVINNVTTDPLSRYSNGFIRLWHHTVGQGARNLATVAS